MEQGQASPASVQVKGRSQRWVGPLPSASDSAMLGQRSITCIVYRISWSVLHRLQKCKPYSAEHLSEHWSHQSLLHTAYDAVHENTDVLKVVAQDRKTIQKPLATLSVYLSGAPDRGLLRCSASSQPFNKLKGTTRKEKRKECLLHTRLAMIYHLFPVKQELGRGEHRGWWAYCNCLTSQAWQIT